MGETPLMSATRAGSARTVSLLLNAGADVNAVEEERSDGTHVGSCSNHSAVTELLLSHGAI